VSCFPFQNSEFDDILVNDLERVITENKPLYDDENLCDENEGRRGAPFF